MIILGTNSIKDTGYDVANSLRFNSGSSDHLNRAFGSSSTDTKATWSFWIKRSKISSGAQFIFQSRDANNNNDRTYFRFSSSDGLDFFVTNSSGTGILALQTNRIFRDVSAWYHIVIKLDTTQGTASNRAKFYINGVEETSFSTATYPDQNANIRTVSNAYTGWGQNIPNNSSFFGGYLSEVCFIDGTALDGDSFGEFDEDSGIWKPKDVSGLTFGTNGYYLEFKESGTGTNTSGMGADTSGNTNHFAVNNLTAIDQSTDTCTNNFATLNGLHKVDDWSLAQGSLEFTNISTGHRMTNSTIAVSQGKWYCEVKMKTEAQQTRVGIIDPDKFLYNNYIHNAGRGYAYKGEDGTIRFNDGTTDGDYGDTYTTGDIIGIAMDLDNHKLYFSKNGTFQNSGDPTSGATGTGAAPDIATGVFYSFGASTNDQGTDPVIEFNFGGTQTFTISSGNADGNGYGNFEYAVPSGYYSLNTKNLAEYG